MVKFLRLRPSGLCGLSRSFAAILRSDTLWFLGFAFLEFFCGQSGPLNPLFEA